MGNKLRIGVFSAHYLPGYKGGGPIKSIRNLIDEMGDQLDFRLVTSDRDLGDSEPYGSVRCSEWNKVGKALVFYAKPGWSGYMEIFRILKADGYDLVYLNSLFSPRFSLFPLFLATILRRSIVLAPRGELSQGALAIKPLKKRIFLLFFRLLKLHKRPVFQVSTRFEAQDIYSVFGPGVDVFIAENIASQDFARNIPVRSPSVLKAVFVSRISPKKNLLAALEMLSCVQNSLSYHIYGPIEDREYWQQCKKIISGLPSHIEVKYMGELRSEEVVPTLSCYDVFFFPTKGENYGHVIAEALCAALPVVIADTTPWRNLEQHGVGRDLPLSNPLAFSAALDELAEMEPEQYLEIRRHVLAWAKGKFLQRDAIDANIAMFKYVYGKNKG